MNEESNTSFDIRAYVDTLINEMGMQDTEEHKLEALKLSMYKQINYIMMNTASLYLEPEVIDYVMNEYGNTDDPFYIYSQFIKHSPLVQVAIMEELDKFAEQTIKAYRQLTKH